MSFETVEHTGDLAVRLRAPDLAGLIASGVDALRGFLFDAEPTGELPAARGEARVAGVDAEDALIQALAEALHLIQAGPLYPQRVRVEQPAPNEVELRIEGVCAPPVDEIKAVTYHAVEIRERDGELETLVVFDV